MVHQLIYVYHVCYRQAFLSVSAIPTRRTTSLYQLFKTEAKLEPFLEPSMQHILNHLQQPEKQSKPINPVESVTDKSSTWTYISPSTTASASSNTTAIKPFASKRASINRIVTGSINVSVHTPDPSYSLCGWLSKKSQSITSRKDTFKTYWFVLVHGELSYYDKEITNDAVVPLMVARKILSCQDITSVTLVERKFIAVKFMIGEEGNKKEGEWIMKAPWPTSVDHPYPKLMNQLLVAATGRMWIRKIARCCPQVIDPTLSLAGYKLTRSIASVDKDAKIFQLKRISKRPLVTFTKNSS